MLELSVFDSEIFKRWRKLIDFRLFPTVSYPILAEPREELSSYDDDDYDDDDYND